jgi:hypothetical protein
MNLYVVLEKNKLLRNKLLTEKDIEEMKHQAEAANWSFVLVEAPWSSIEWSQVGGRGGGAYPKGEIQTTLRVPKSISYQVKQYAIWLSRQ